MLRIFRFPHKFPQCEHRCVGFNPKRRWAKGIGASLPSQGAARSPGLCCAQRSTTGYAVRSWPSNIGKQFATRPPLRMPSENQDKSVSVEPFLKWAGGKRWLIPHLKLEKLKYSGRYIEPFLGSGAIYFALRPKRAIISDINESLVDAYRCVRDCPDEISEILGKHQLEHSKAYYYEVRSNMGQNPIDRAASLIYLNRTCWNGLYRVNRKGKFNVPKGTKSSVLLNSDSWPAVADALSGAQIVARDFEISIDEAASGDLLFVDPPYTVKHNLNGFLKYNESLFSWDDQIRLHAALLRASLRSVNIIATNADHESIRELYKVGFKFRRLERSSVLSGDPSFRGRYSELLITAKL